MKKFLAVTTVALTLAPVAHAQDAALLQQARTACSVAGGSCLAFMQALRVSPEFLALAPAERSAFVGTVAAEIRDVGVEIVDVAIDADIAEALDELADVAEDEGDTTLAESLEAIAVEIETGGGEETEEVPTGTFSDN